MSSYSFRFTSGSQAQLPFNGAIRNRASRRSSTSSFSDGATSDISWNSSGSQLLSQPSIRGESALSSTLQKLETVVKLEETTVDPQAVVEWRQAVPLSQLRLASVNESPAVLPPSGSYLEQSVHSRGHRSLPSTTSCPKVACTITSALGGYLSRCSRVASNSSSGQKVGTSSPQTISSSPESIFSKVSPTSSASSVSDGTTSSNIAPYNYSISSTHNSQTARQSCFRAGRHHPRRTTAKPSWNKPALVREHFRRQELVNKLVESATALVALIWPTADQEKGSPCDMVDPEKALPLQHFIQETLRRSRTSYSTLQLTLWYLTLIYPNLPRGKFTMKQSGEDDFFKSILCGRRMFLAALMLASKFLQDRNFTARAWSKITGLPAREITSNEFGFVRLIGWKLHLQGPEFHHWNRIVICCTEAHKIHSNMKSTWALVLASREQGCDLSQISQELIDQVKLHPSLTNFDNGTHCCDTKATSYQGPETKLGYKAPSEEICSSISSFDAGSTPAASMSELANKDTGALGSLKHLTTPPSSQTMQSQTSANSSIPSLPSRKSAQEDHDLESSFRGAICPTKPSMQYLPTPESSQAESSECGEDSIGKVLSGQSSSTIFPQAYNIAPAESDFDTMESLQTWAKEQSSASQWIAMLAEAAQVSNNTAEDVSQETLALPQPLIEDETQVPTKAFEPFLPNKRDNHASLKDGSEILLPAKRLCNIEKRFGPLEKISSSEMASSPSNDLQQLVRANLEAPSVAGHDEVLTDCIVATPSHGTVALSMMRSAISGASTLSKSTENNENIKRVPKRPIDVTKAPAARDLKVRCMR